MGNTASAATSTNQSPSLIQDSKATTTTGEKPKCKACCACPETKKIRDECIMLKGEEGCSDLIEKHKQCMRDMGFNI